LDLVKECLIALLYGAPLNANPEFTEIGKILSEEKAKLFVDHPFVKSLRQEIKSVGEVIVRDTHSNRGCYVTAMQIEAQLLVKKFNTFKLLCHALQGVEALILKTVITLHGEDILLCMHDGWISRKRLNCNDLELAISNATGFNLKIEEKQLPKYMPIKGAEPAWPFSDSSPTQRGSLVVSASSDWNAKDGVHGRVTRPDTKFKVRK
jgi:hypothetical protein